MTAHTNATYGKEKNEWLCLSIYEKVEETPLVMLSSFTSELNEGYELVQYTGIVEHFRYKFVSLSLPMCINERSKHSICCSKTVLPMEWTTDDHLNGELFHILIIDWFAVVKQVHVSTHYKNHKSTSAVIQAENSNITPQEFWFTLLSDIWIFLLLFTTAYLGARPDF